ISLIFRHKLVHDIYKHYKFTELRSTYSNTLVCFKIFHLLNLHSKIPIDVFGICEKNKPGRGANFTVRPRTQNCLATPLGILFVSVNGMPLNCWDPKPYVMTWLKSGRHSADDKPVGKVKRKTVVNILLYFSNLHNVWVK